MSSRSTSGERAVENGSRYCGSWASSSASHCCSPWCSWARTFCTCILNGATPEEVAELLGEMAGHVTSFFAQLG